MNEGKLKIFVWVIVVVAFNFSAITVGSDGATPDQSTPPPISTQTDARIKTPDACDSNIPDCLNVLSKPHKIGHLKTHKEILKCPSSHPWYAVWTSSTTSALVTVTEDPFAKIRFTGRGDAFLVTNLSPIHDHHWQISIACSTGCQFAPGGCPCGKGEFGCRSDPGCKTTISRTTRCTPDDASCWTTWTETCKDGKVWECNTTLFWTCCNTCQ